MLKRYVLEPWSRLVRDKGFLFCVVLLAVCAAGLRVGAERFKLHFRKLPLSLQKPLSELDSTLLRPYKLVAAQVIPEEIEEELGTKEYVQWRLEDSSVAANDPLRVADLFVTYYTGDPDRVPHVPDWCYVGSGWQVGGARNTKITVPDNGTTSESLPVRVLTMELKTLMGEQSKIVAYFFVVNGEYRCTRTEVRMRQNSLTEKYAYFSKVEIAFPESSRLTEKEVLAAVEKLAQKVVPVLVRDHWPDWEKINQKVESE